MKLKQTLGILLIATIFALHLNAQVTIGSDSAPIDGALLDLKENGATTKGLGLPRVELKDLTKLTMGSNVITNTGTLWQDHAGLVVYNIAKVETKSKRVCPGIHIWDGEIWQPIVPYADVQEQKVLKSTVRSFEYLDDSSLASDWPVGKTVADYPLGYIGTFTDNRVNDAAQTYNYTRFYVGYRMHTITYDIKRSYTCNSATPTWISEGTETAKERISFEDGVWMAENLRAIHMPDGTAITLNATSNATTPYCHYPNLQPTNRATLGVLYNWAAAINMGTGTGQTPDPENVIQGGSGADDVRIQGVCPDNWRLPSDQDFTDLENGIILNTATFSSTGNIGGTLLGYDGTNVRGTTHGTAMKATNSTINSYASGGSSKTAAQGGFDAFLVGLAAGGSANSYGNGAIFWSASNSGNGANAWARMLISTYTQTIRGNYSRNHLYSVRCMKND